MYRLRELCEEKYFTHLSRPSAPPVPVKSRPITDPHLLTHEDETTRKGYICTYMYVSNAGFFVNSKQNWFIFSFISPFYYCFPYFPSFPLLISLFPSSPFLPSFIPFPPSFSILFPLYSFVFPLPLIDSPFQFPPVPLFLLISPFSLLPFFILLPLFPPFSYFPLILSFFSLPPFFLT